MAVLASADEGASSIRILEAETCAARRLASRILSSGSRQPRTRISTSTGQNYLLTNNDGGTWGSFCSVLPKAGQLIRSSVKSGAGFLSRWGGCPLQMGHFLRINHRDRPRFSAVNSGAWGNRAAATPSTIRSGPAFRILGTYPMCCARSHYATVSSSAQRLRKSVAFRPCAPVLRLHRPRTQRLGIPT